MIIEAMYDIGAEEARRDAVASVENSFRWMSLMSRISDKSGKIVRMFPNAGQRKLISAMSLQMDTTSMIRIIILKARQIGFSTAIAQYFTCHLNNREGVNSLVMAHEGGAGGNLYQKYDLGYKSLPGIVKTPATVYQREKRLTLSNRSQLDVRTAGSDVSTASSGRGGATRSFTYQHVHLSELAFMPDPGATLTALGQTVPDIADTAIFIESTANGMGNLFESEWKRAIEGKSGYMHVFVGWHEHDEYSRPFASSSEHQSFASDLGNNTKARYGNEVDMLDLYDLALEQLNWRRRMIDSEGCRGDIEIFQQEYPGNPDEAFIGTGRPVFLISSIDWYKKKADTVESEVGELVEKTDPETDKKTLELVKNGGGILRVFKRPDLAVEYIIGGDVGQGLESGDYSTLFVASRKPFEQVAEVRCHLDPLEFADLAAQVGKWYNDAWLAIEANDNGVSVNAKLGRELLYINLFTMEHFHKRKMELTERMGWLTTSSTRPILVSEGQAVFRERSISFVSAQLCSEARTFIWKNGKPQAARKGQGRKLGEPDNGYYDDMVFAFMIASVAHGLLPMQLKLKKTYDFPDMIGEFKIIKGSTETDPAPNIKKAMKVKHSGSGGWLSA